MESLGRAARPRVVYNISRAGATRWRQWAGVAALYHPSTSDCNTLHVTSAIVSGETAMVKRQLGALRTHHLCISAENECGSREMTKDPQIEEPRKNHREEISPRPEFDAIMEGRLRREVTSGSASKSATILFCSSVSRPSTKLSAASVSGSRINVKQQS